MFDFDIVRAADPNAYRPWDDSEVEDLLAELRSQGDAPRRESTVDERSDFEGEELVMDGSESSEVSDDDDPPPPPPPRGRRGRRPKA